MKIFLLRHARHVIIELEEGRRPQISRSVVVNIFFAFWSRKKNVKNKYLAPWTISGYVTQCTHNMIAQSDHVRKTPNKTMMISKGARPPFHTRGSYPLCNVWMKSIQTYYVHISVFSQQSQPMYPCVHLFMLV